MSIIPSWLHFTFSPINWIGLTFIRKGNPERIVDFSNEYFFLLEKVSVLKWRLSTKIYPFVRSAQILTYLLCDLQPEEEGLSALNKLWGFFGRAPRTPAFQDFLEARKLSKKPNERLFWTLWIIFWKLQLCKYFWSSIFCFNFRANFLCVEFFKISQDKKQHT